MMAEWSRCGALQQRARAVSLATLTLALAVVSTGASRQADVLGMARGVARRRGVGGVLVQVEVQTAGGQPEVQ